MLHENVELVLWVLATPVLIHYFLYELIDVDNLIVSFFLIEFIASPNKHFMLIVLVTWNTDLSSNTNDEE
jgi:hypothetical protein